MRKHGLVFALLMMISVMGQADQKDWHTEKPTLQLNVEVLVKKLHAALEVGDEFKFSGHFVRFADETTGYIVVPNPKGKDINYLVVETDDFFAGPYGGLPTISYNAKAFLQKVIVGKLKPDAVFQVQDSPELIAAGEPFYSVSEDKTEALRAVLKLSPYPGKPRAQISRVFRRAEPDKLYLTDLSTKESPLISIKPSK